MPDQTKMEDPDPGHKKGDKPNKRMGSNYGKALRRREAGSKAGALDLPPEGQFAHLSDIIEMLNNPRVTNPGPWSPNLQDPFDNPIAGGPASTRPIGERKGGSLVMKSQPTVDKLRSMTRPDSHRRGIVDNIGRAKPADKPSYAEETKAPSPGSRKLPPARPGNRGADVPSSIKPPEPGGGKVPGPQTGKKPPLRPLRAVKTEKVGPAGPQGTPPITRQPRPAGPQGTPPITKVPAPQSTPPLKRPPIPPKPKPTPKTPKGPITMGVRTFRL